MAKGGESLGRGDLCVFAERCGNLDGRRCTLLDQQGSAPPHSVLLSKPAIQTVDARGERFSVRFLALPLFVPDFSL